MARIRDLGINVIPGASNYDLDITPVIMAAGESDADACGAQNNCTHTEDDDECGGAPNPCSHTEDSCDKQNDCTHTEDDCDAQYNCSHTEEDEGEDEVCDEENDCSHTEYEEECDQTCSHTEDRPAKSKKEAQSLGAHAVEQLTQQLETHLANELEN